MTNYIIRRLLLMIPTIIGITFLVFFLIAMSPGGIGASLQVAGGNMTSANSIAVTRAKLEDRYGLNEPWPVQYVRWFTRINPIKFGQRDLVKPDGELVSRPREIARPPAWNWFAETLPEPAKLDRAAIESTFRDAPDAERAAAFARLEREYVNARSAAVADEALLRDALKRYIEGEFPRGQWGNYISGDKLRVGRVAALAPNKSSPVWQELSRLGPAAITSWAAAVEVRQRLVAAMASEPFPGAGLAIIPGVLSVAPPDLGVAFSTGKPVASLIADHLPVTLLLNLVAFPIIYFIAVPCGVLAAVRKGTWADTGLGGIFIGLYSVPVVLAGVLLLGYLATPEHLNLFPTAGRFSKDADSMTFWPSDGSPGYVVDALWHMVLPVACLVYGGFAVLSKQARAAMLENLSADYVRTAKAKGVAPGDVLLAHVFRNSLLPLITMFVTIFPAMLAGSVVIERIFSVPGMGSLLIDAINQRDRELILANTTIIACVNLMALLLADILYAAADPRITYK